MKRRVAPWVLVCLVLAPCAHGPELGLSLVARPPGRLVALERVPAAARPAATSMPRLPADLQARFVPGAAPPVVPGRKARVETPFDLGVRMTPRPLSIPDVAPGTSARFAIDATRRGWVAKLEEQSLLTPVFAEGKVMVGGGFGSHTFYGLDALSGRFAWSTEASDGGPSAGIAVEDKVLFNTESCTLFCVDPKTGRLLWKQWLGDPVMGQPAAAHGVVYSGHILDRSRGYALSALRLADGHPIWQRAIDADVLSAPVIAGSGADASVFVATMAGTVYRFRSRDGAMLWRSAADATSAPWIDGPRVLLSRRLPEDREQQVVLSAADGRMVAAGRAAAAPYARMRPDTGGVQAGWSYEGSRPVLAAGRAYYAMGAELRARDLTTGEEVWRRRMPGADAQRGITPPAIAAGALVVGTRGGDVYGIDVDTGATTFAFRIGEPIVSQPVIAHGWVYCATTAGSVFGLEVGDAGLDGWHMWGGSPTHTGPLPATLEPPAAPADDPTEGILRATVDGRPVLVAPHHTRLDVQVSGIVARVEIDQVFVNPTDAPLDAAYLLPLPADAAVDAMEMVVGDRVVRARIQRRAEARATFAAARARGDTATLLEEERPNLFQERVTNIPARGEVHIEVRLAVTLRTTDEGEEPGVPRRAQLAGVELALPLVAAARYQGGGAAPEPAAATRRGDAVEVRVQIDAGTPLAEVASPSHEVQIARPTPATAVVTLVPRTSIPNRDFVLRTRVAAPEARAALLATRTGERGTFVLLLHPPERIPSSAVAPRELVVLVDASSSMSGRPFEMARALTAEAAGALGPADTLRVVAFADRAQSMTPAAVPGGAAAARDAERFLATVRPHGGTELAAAVQAALGAPADPARVRVVLLLGDGNVGDDDEVLQLVARALGPARLHTIGLGAAPNRWLLEQAAELGRGTCAVVGLAEDAGRAGQALAARLGRPLLTDLTIDWGGLPVRDVYPRMVPDLSAGEPLLVVGRYDGAGTGTVRLRGVAAGRAWTQDVAVALPARETRHEVLGSVWARRRVHDLDTAMLLRASDELREEIARIGLEHGLVTSETSLVAVAPGTPARAAAAPSDALYEAWSFSSDYWSDELGAYRAQLDIVRPDGELAMARRIAMPSKTMSPSFGRAEIMWGGREEPIMNEEVLPSRPPPRTDGQIQAVFAGVAQEIVAVYRAALERDRTLGGRLVLEVTIRPDGTVAFAQVLAASTIGDAALHGAVLRIVRRLSFVAGPPQTVEFPIDLAPAR